MQNAIRRGLCAAALTLAMFASASAQDTMRVRGTIERVEGPVYVIKTRDGAELKVALAEPGLVVALVKASMADIKPGLFVGSTGMPQPDGHQTMGAAITIGTLSKGYSTTLSIRCTCRRKKRWKVSMSFKPKSWI